MGKRSKNNMSARNLKFRVWDKKNNEFINDDSKSYDGNGITLNGVYAECSQSQFGYQKEPENYIVQQFTGWKDQNGKEIYDGDVITYGMSGLSAPRGAVPCGEGWTKIEEVKWPEYSTIRQSMTRIIGNIFENPELLDQIKENEEKYPGFCPFCGPRAASECKN